MFNWLDFFEANKISYRTKGPNISAGNVVVACPWCGSLDPGEHLSVSLSGKGYRCFRNPQHRGTNPAYLIQKLTNWSFAEASAACGRQLYMPDDFMGKVNSLLRPEQTVEPIRKLALLPEFRRLDKSISCRPFISYLQGRGFDDPIEVGKQFDLYYAKRGAFGGRVIFPVYHRQRLVTWTGRHVGTSTLRYRTLTTDYEKSRSAGLPQAIGPITDYLLWYDRLTQMNAHTLCIVEGPFDALKVNYLGLRHGIVATCLFTLDISESQINLLHELAPKFRDVVLLLDRGTVPQSIRLQSRLQGLAVRIQRLPNSLKDPALIDSFINLQKVLAR